MKRSRINGSRSDRAGILIALLCFVHCVAGPVLLTFAGLASAIGVSERFESVFLLGSASMGAIALVPGYRRKHGRPWCLTMFGCGLLCLLVRRHIEWRSSAAEAVAACVGAILLVSAHLLNLRFSRRCECCRDVTEAIPEEAHENSQSG